MYHPAWLIAQVPPRAVRPVAKATLKSKNLIREAEASRSLRKAKVRVLDVLASLIRGAEAPRSLRIGALDERPVAKATLNPRILFVRLKPHAPSDLALWMKGGQVVVLFVRCRQHGA